MTLPALLWPSPVSQVRHEDLEKHDGVPSGKYTVGLGQQGLAFVGDREDAVSMASTVLRRLLEKHSISPLEVGAAGLLDGRWAAAGPAAGLGGSCREGETTGGQRRCWCGRIRQNCGWSG